MTQASAGIGPRPVVEPVATLAELAPAMTAAGIPAQPDPDGRHVRIPCQSCPAGWVDVRATAAGFVGTCTGCGEQHRYRAAALPAAPALAPVANTAPAPSTPAAALDAKKPSSRSQLRSSPPLELGELPAWLTVVFGLGADPLQEVVRFGRHDEAPMVLTTESGARIVFERQADVFDRAKLVRRVTLSTGASLPHYTAADAQVIATALVRIADVAADDDDRAEAREWARTFLAGAERNTRHVADITTPAGRYEALSILAGWIAPGDLPSYAPAAERAPIVLVGDGRRLVRTSDVAAHVRGVAGRPVSWPSLHGRLTEIGWEHAGELQQRQPGGPAKRKAHIYVIPATWEDA